MSRTICGATRPHAALFQLIVLLAVVSPAPLSGAVNPPATAWAGVQWGDPSGTHWFNIAPWFGAVNQTEGRMAFWVNPAQFGTGPYRWVIYTQDPAHGGTLWGVSDPFFFPRTAQEWVWVNVTASATPIK